MTINANIKTESQINTPQLGILKLSGKNQLLINNKILFEIINKKYQNVANQMIMQNITHNFDQFGFLIP